MATNKTLWRWEVFGWLLLTLAFIALLCFVFIYYIKDNLQKFGTDIENVKQAVTVQTKDLKTLQEKKEAPPTPIPNSLVYVNKELGFQLKFANENDYNIYTEAGTVYFGALDDYEGVKLPKYSLRVWPGTLEKYSERFCFEGEKCKGSDLINLPDKITSTRAAQLKKLLGSELINNLSVTTYTDQGICLFSVALVYNVDKKAVYEFSEHCSSSTDPMAGLKKVLNNFSWIK